MRSRNIKIGFFENEELGECSFAARLLFVGLWCLADREGRLEDRRKRISAELFPYDDVDMDSLLNELAAHSFIVCYTVDDKKYIALPTFKKHQNPHPHEKGSTIPAPDCVKDIALPREYEMSRKSHDMSRQCNDITRHCPADILNPDVPDSVTSGDEDIDLSDKENAASSQGMVIEEPCLEDNTSPPDDSPPNNKQLDSPPLEEWFNKFFQHYPRRDSKKKAHQTFMAVFKGIPPQRQRHRMENIVLRLTRYAHDRKDEDPKYTKLPTTWLNSYDWDEVPTEDECLMTERWVTCKGKEGA